MSMIVNPSTAVVGVADPNFGSTVGLFYFDGTNGSQTDANQAFDNSAGALPAFGTAGLSTTQQKFGVTSARCLGTTNNWQQATGKASWGFGTGAFTLEFWMYLDSLATAQNVFDMRPAVNGAYPTIYVNTNGSIAYFSNSTTRCTSSSGLITTATWYFIAYSKPSGSSTGQLSVDASNAASWTDTETYSNGGLALLGSSAFAGTGQGYVDMVRMSKGVARTIVLPTTAFPNH